MKKNNNTLIAVFLLFVGMLLGAILVPNVMASNQERMVSEGFLEHQNALKALPRPLEETTNMEELDELIQDCDMRMSAAADMAEGARKLGYSNDHDIIELAGHEWEIAFNQKKYYVEIYEENNYNLIKQKQQEYPSATYIWMYLKDYGYNDAVCAGIIGNMMTEVGGQTLQIQPMLHGNGYYGICQWSKKYYPQAVGLELSAQCKLLTDTIKEQIDTYGSNYKRGFNYSSFIELIDPKQAALAFAKTYERCGSGSYKIRQNNAVVAMNYFTN